VDGPVFEALGMRTAFIENMMAVRAAREAYLADVTYGTNSEFGFDYLRDNMAVSLDGIVQRGHSFAIVDEVDSILIDEARTPLIISGEPETAPSSTTTSRASSPTSSDIARARAIRKAQPRQRARLRVRREAQDRRRHRVGRREGRARVADREPLLAAELAARQPSRQALKAQSLYQRDVDT
jgi:Preprotein translocase subunit SecA (ATPase, RNA helicase)